MRRLIQWCVSSVTLAGLGCQPPEPASAPRKAAAVTQEQQGTAIKPATGISPKTVPATPTETTEPGGTTKTASGLTYSTLKTGDGTPAGPGDKVSVQARGTLEDGTVFLDTTKAGQPWTFTVGDAGVVLGVNEGVTGMRPGERRKLTLPPQIGYGALGTFVENPKEGQPSIPPNATLTYEIELLKSSR